MTELKPCPFCGEVPDLEFTGRFYQVCCGSFECDIRPSTDYYETKQNAIEAWNTRKGEEVRKETVREILNEVGNVYICLDEYNEEMYARDFGWFKSLCKKHGVEVEK